MRHYNMRVNIISWLLRDEEMGWGVFERKGGIFIQWAGRTVGKGTNRSLENEGARRPRNIAWPSKACN
jgi:hypothetical protein